MLSSTNKAIAKNLSAASFLAALLLAAVLGVSGCAGAPVNKGLENGHLADCPNSPNCVSSSSQQEDKKVAAWRYTGTPQQAQAALMTLLSATENAAVISHEPGYLHATFTTPLMGFVDDVEFQIVEGRINVRSASRVGYSDFGMNRKRVEQLKAAFLPCCVP